MKVLALDLGNEGQVLGLGFGLVLEISVFRAVQFCLESVYTHG